MKIIYGGAGGVRGREGSGRDMHSHKYAVRYGLVALKYRNSELTRLDYSKYIMTRESSLLFFVFFACSACL